MMRVTVDAVDVRRQLARIGDMMAGHAADRTAEDLEAQIEDAAGAHTKTGALFRSVTKARVPGGWEISHDAQIAPYAVFVHWGTRPHRIEPRKKRALRWPGGGAGFVFSRGVNHPGYAGDAWMVRAAADAPRIFAAHVARLIQSEG